MLKLTLDPDGEPVVPALRVRFLRPLSVLLKYKCNGFVKLLYLLLLLEL
jgi:hypothetical protein